MDSDFIIKSKKIHGDKFDYSLVEYLGRSIKVKLICLNHGMFESSPSVHLRTKSGGCPLCIGKLSTSQFIEIANKTHKNKYDYSLVKVINNRDKVKIICNNHDSPFTFLQSTYFHINRKYGCPLCAGKFSYGHEEFISKSKKIHKELFDYSLVSLDYKDTKSKVRIICRKHGIFYQTPNAHLKGDGCIRCYKRNIVNLNVFLEECNKIHKNKYDYSKVIFETVKDNIIISCPIHGEFNQVANNHLRGSGCRKCSGVEKYTIESLIDKFKSIHKDTYDYSKVELKSSVRQKVCIICRKHGEFYQEAFMHYSSQHGCPKCKSSKGEIRILDWLNINKIDYLHQHKFDDLRGSQNFLVFDFYLPNLNMCIEYDGIQHYEPRSYFGGGVRFNLLKVNDNLKNEYCLSKGINLIRIGYQDYDKIEDYLTKYIK